MHRQSWAYPSKPHSVFILSVTIATALTAAVTALPHTALHRYHFLHNACRTPLRDKQRATTCTTGLLYVTVQPPFWDCHNADYENRTTHTTCLAF